MNTTSIQQAMELAALITLIDRVPDDVIPRVVTIVENIQLTQGEYVSTEDVVGYLENKYVSGVKDQAELDRIDAERYRKLRAAINRLARLPESLREFIAVTAGSNAQGIDEQIDDMLDYRTKYPYGK